jgi:hypothetical protein
MSGPANLEAQPYKVLRHIEARELEKLVAEHMAKGYEPAGGLIVAIAYWRPSDHREPLFMQAVYKPVPPLITINQVGGPR